MSRTHKLAVLKPRSRFARAQQIGEILDELFAAPEIPLDHADPFQLLIAVMLSAQTTDRAVNQVTPKLFAAAPTALAMANLGAPRILELIRTLGLAPTKAKHVAETAARLLTDHAGAVPTTLTALERLPGVGHKTASVVLVQAFGIPAFPVDTHIHRLAARWQLSDGSNVRATERDLKAVFPEITWGRRHLQMIYFGRTYCPARGHEPERCPICAWAISGSARPLKTPSRETRRR